MGKTVRWLGQLILIGNVAGALACADTSTQPEKILGGAPDSHPRFMTYIGGDEFYEDENSGELVPTSIVPARITNQLSEATITCNDSDCDAIYKASHEGLWHWSKQNFHWAIKEGGTQTTIVDGQTEKTGGISCTERILIVFCVNKKQSNQVPASANVDGCSATATLSTEHEAGWGMRASIGPNGVTIDQNLTFGENPQSSHAEGFDNHRCTECDNPNTAEIEECGANEATSAGTPGGGGGGGPCPECITEPIDDGPQVCTYRYWYRKDTGEWIRWVILYCL